MSFRLMTSANINYGNYVLVSKKVIKTLNNSNFAHLSAFLSKTKFHKSWITIDRCLRISGKSKIGYKGLFLHSLYSVMEYTEEMIYFLLKFLGGILLFSIGVVLWVIRDKFLYGIAIPGWSSLILLITLVLVIQIFGLIMVVLFLKFFKSNLSTSKMLAPNLAELSIENYRISK